MALRFSFNAITIFALILSSHIALGQEEPKVSQAQLDKLKATIEKLQKELEKTRTARDEINQALENTEKNISTLGKKARSIEQELDKRQKKLDDLRDERSQLNEKKKGQEELVGDYINAAYRLGQQSNIRLLLNQEDPARVSRNLKYYNYFADARAEKISEFLTTINRINKVEPEIAYQTDLVAQDLKTLQKQRSKLKSAQGKRRQLLSRINKKILSQDQTLRAKLEDRNHLQKLLNKVIENVADIAIAHNETNFSKLKGRLPWPTKGKLLKRFGSSRVANKLRWEGMLISSNTGDPVRSIHHGRVVFSDYLRGHGLLIIVDHGTGFMSLYAHNQTLYKELGEWVEPGEIIAAVGNTGGQQNSALYFELRKNGKPTDPQRWLQRA